MTHAQQIREEVLLQLYGAGLGISLSPKQMMRTAQRAGLSGTDMDFLQAALFLTGQKFAERIEDPASGVVRFTITTTGVLKKENG